MRSFIVATGILVLAAHADAQSTTASAPAPSSTNTATAAPAEDPPLIKTVAEDPNDSPMVRAAKRAVASRQNPKQRRVVSITSSSTATRGRVAVSSGPAHGPKVPPPPSDAKTITPKKPPTPAELAAQHRAMVLEKLRKLEAEEGPLGVEADEQYGHEMDEDAVEKRLTEIAAERKKLLESLNSPPPPPR
ncbi:MAG TPA: hypothetical protein VFV49_09920 [Thermoanaerobaculia bacterium]|nr:hypothetical protein [Thermoanaerobaculia bacterium]